MSGQRRGPAHHVQLCHGKIAGQHSKAAIGRDHKPVSVNTLLRRPDPLDDFVDRLDSASRHRYRTENDGLVLKQAEQFEVVSAMRVLDRDLMDRQRVHGAGQPVIALRVGFPVVLVIEVIGISAADMDRARHMVRHIVEAAL